MTEQLEQKILNLFCGKIFIIFRWYIDKSSTFSAEQFQMIATKAK